MEDYRIKIIKNVVSSCVFIPRKGDLLKKPGFGDDDEGDVLVVIFFEEDGELAVGEDGGGGVGGGAGVDGFGG